MPRQILTLQELIKELKLNKIPVIDYQDMDDQADAHIEIGNGLSVQYNEDEGYGCTVQEVYEDGKDYPCFLIGDPILNPKTLVYKVREIYLKLSLN